MAPLQLEAAEILRRSEQGVCRPFFIRDTQGDIYVVKGVGGAGKAALTSELICAELGLRLGLPIPPYGIMTIPQGLISFTAIDGADELDGGPAFASKLVVNATTLIYLQVSQIPPELKQRVLVFDKWVYKDMWDDESLVQPTLDERFELLNRIHNGDFWRMV